MRHMPRLNELLHNSRTGEAKPIDRWLGLGAAAMSVALFLLPKTPIVVVICLGLIFALLAHPAWHFWWIEDVAWRRILALMGLLAFLFVIGYFSWPRVQQPTAFASELGPILEYPPSGFVLVYDKTGYRETPIDLLARIDITNEQSMSTSIESYDLETADSKHGPWTFLCSLRLGRGIGTGAYLYACLVQ
jgi:hypothetical protein